MRRPEFLLLIATFLLAGSTVRSADVDPILPADTYQVLHIDVKQLAKTKFAKHTIDNTCVTILGNYANVELEFNKELGINIIKDVDTITSGNGRDLIILRGKFNIADLTASAKKASLNKDSKFSMVKEGDFEFILYGEGRAAQKYIALVNEKLIICGYYSKEVADCVTVARSKDAKPRISKELAAVIQKQDSKATVLFAATFMKGKHHYGEGSQIILHVVFPHLKEKSEELHSIADDAQVGSVTVRTGKVLDIEIAVGTKYKEAAVVIAKELLAGTKAELKDEEWKRWPKAFMDDFSKGLKSKAKEKDAVLTFHFSAAACDSLISWFDEQDLAEKKKVQNEPKEKVITPELPVTLPSPSKPLPSK